MRQQKFKVYQYPIKHPNGTVYYGSYTIKSEAQPKHFKGEKLVQKFTTTVLEDGEISFIKENEFAKFLGGKKQ